MRSVMAYDITVTRHGEVETLRDIHNNEEDALIVACNIILFQMKDNYSAVFLTAEEAMEVLGAIENDSYEEAIDEYNRLMSPFGFSVEVGYTRVYLDREVEIYRDVLSDLHSLYDGI